MIDRSRWREELQARFSPSKIWPAPEVEDGWKDLLCDLADALDATGVRYIFVQLANHAGALRCLLGSAEDEPRLEELHDLVDRARDRSRLTCPRCGKSGCACPASSEVRRDAVEPAVGGGFAASAAALVDDATTDRNVFIGAALAQLKPCDWQDAERRAQRLKASAVAQRALDAVVAGTSTVSAAARDRLCAGLDALCLDTEWTGPMVAWLDCLLRSRGWAKAGIDLDADALVTHYLQDCLPLSNVIGGCPVLDASEPEVPPSVPLAMVRQDATLVLPIADPERARWLRAFAASLGMENLVVVEQAIEEQRDRTLFDQIISRSDSGPRQVLAGTQHRMALGGRWFLLHAQIDAADLQRLPQGTQFVQAIAIPAPGLEAPRQILHITTGVGQTAAAPMRATDRNVDIGTALAQLKPCDWQEAERRAQRLRASAVAQQALDAVVAGTSTVSAAARDRLRAGLDTLCMDTAWAGPMVAWLDCLLRGPGRAKAGIDLDADALVTHYLQDCLPLSNVIGGCPVFDASEPEVPPGLPLAMVRQDATLVLPIADPERAGWLRAFAASLGMENLVVVEQAVEEQRDRTLFEQIISRSDTGPRQMLAGTQHRMALGGRWFLLRARIDAAELQGLPQGAEFVQAIAIPAPGLEAPRQILHIATGVSQLTAALMHGSQQHAAPAGRKHSSRELEPAPGLLTIPEILQAARLTLNRIEAEMKRIGFWTSDPPPLLEMANRGDLSSYLDAPSFEQWLQCVFLARARAAVKNDALPASSSVAEMARRQYDYHSHVPEAQLLLKLLRAFDVLVDQRGEAGREPPQRHVRDDRPEEPPNVLEAASAGGRVLKKGTWRSSGWPCVNVEPWDDRYFRLALQHIADQFGIPVPEITDDSEDPDPRAHTGADFVLEGVQVSAVAGRRCSFAAAREDIRDRIFDSLLRLKV